MPTYPYRCTQCETAFDVNRPMRSTAEERCPECGEVARRVFTPVGVAFKGTGFHNTDYRPRPTESAEAPAPACPAAATGSCPAGGSCGSAD